MNVGIVGLGHLGKIHLKLLKELHEFTVTSVYDIDHELTNVYASMYQAKACENYNELLLLNDAICIVTPTPSHFELAEMAIRQGKHVFIEKPATSNLDDTKKLIKLAREANVVVQVGHVERFNPAFIAAKNHLKDPLFFEVHRLTSYNKRGTDVSVVYDLMIHDIDLVLSTVKSKVKRIMASGTAVVSDTADLVNARLEFENGCVANLTANRIALHNLRKIRIFQRDEYISIDLLHKHTTISRIQALSNSNPLDSNTTLINDHQLEIKQLQPVIQPINAIKAELQCFYESIVNKMPIVVSLNDAEAALTLAQEIEFQITR